MRYTGPIIDAHHHLWDLSSGRYPWLTAPDASIVPLGNIDYFRHSYLPADYAADITGQGIAGSVHIEALWDPARSPVEETQWLDALPGPPGIAVRYVAAAPLTAPNLPELLAGHAASPRVAGLRETIRWHPARDVPR